jgi:hypothetical protein
VIPRRSRALSVTVAIGAAGCAAPPMGLGSGAVFSGAPGSSRLVAAGATGMAASGTRTVFQAEASLAFQQRPPDASLGGGIEAGLVYTQLEERGASGEVFVVGGFPYVRPRLIVGPASLAVALAGFAMGAGGGGVMAGFADAQLGVGSETSSIYAGAYTLVYDVAGGNRTVAKQLRIGGEHLWQLRGVRFGLALEVYAQDDAFVDRGPDTDTDGDRPSRSRRVESTFTGGGLKLRIDSGSRGW